jgi:molybdopterin/thiamine biosynthesis adenylyltransferase
MSYHGEVWSTEFGMTACRPASGRKVVEPTYEEITQRNIGVFTPQEQARIRSLVVAVAGCGALGAPAAVYLARLGVGELRLADPEEYEPSNVNRQFAAYIDTIGVNKAEAVAAELARISPHLKVRTFVEGVSSDTIAAFLDGADAVVDGIDFYELDTELLLHREARRRGQWVFASQGVGEMTTTTCFDPAQAALEEMVSEQGHASVVRAIESFMPVLPKAATPELVAAAVAGELPSVPSDVTGGAFGGAFLVDDIVRVAVRGLPARVVAPDLYVLDQDELRLGVWDARRRVLVAR